MRAEEVFYMCKENLWRANILWRARRVIRAKHVRNSSANPPSFPKRLILGDYLRKIWYDSNGLLFKTDRKRCEKKSFNNWIYLNHLLSSNYTIYTKNKIFEIIYWFFHHRWCEIRLEIMMSVSIKEIWTNEVSLLFFFH